MQDFNKEVQRLVNREQDEEFIFALLNHAREIGFTSTNIDLIYGLPKQTPESFAFTLKRVAELNLTVWASLTTRICRPFLPPSAKSKMLTCRVRSKNSISCGKPSPSWHNRAISLSVWITLPVRDDELAVAQREGVLHRNFQGYTTRNTDLLGMGVSAISMIGDCYAEPEELKRVLSAGSG